MITVYCRFAHSLKIMARRDPVCFEVSPLQTVQRHSYVRGGEGHVWFTCCIEGQDSEIYELWNFANDGIHEVHPFAWVQISNDFTGILFTPTFSMPEQFELLSWATSPSI